MSCAACGGNYRIVVNEVRKMESRRSRSLPIDGNMAVVAKAKAYIAECSANGHYIEARQEHLRTA